MERTLTQSLEDLPWLLEFYVEVPAATERTHWRFRSVAFPADHADLGAIRAIGERAWDTRGIGVISDITRKTGLLPTFLAQALGTWVRPSCIASVGRPTAGDRGVQACQVRGLAFQRG